MGRRKGSKKRKHGHDLGSSAFPAEKPRIVLNDMEIVATHRGVVCACCKRPPDTCVC